jgi:hypothetical protein
VPVFVPVKYLFLLRKRIRKHYLSAHLCIINKYFKQHRAGLDASGALHLIRREGFRNMKFLSLTSQQRASPSCAIHPVAFATWTQAHQENVGAALFIIIF